ncbi:MAG: KH domain-containing protein [Synergistes jonesii]|uniref:RNA-binding protein KhpA n=2 Tax=Synergistes jonesii TaxID=2754 RepID=A0A073ISU0_9BACT|nr:KH domain-containing protein [Synergistes jonesii]KEJ92879.1 RNA-binding protein [Synergistes jonesii]MDY2985987.1 KH domain-containing protein [Synergistes jonesii]OFB64165.1 RNA-binding protein [Synergistes jonesii]OFB64658.1 RNA-binding protein [Synergistes jonesii]OFB65387.1 RNA-binding protein [Synergistes jonesii]
MANYVELVELIVRRLVTKPEEVFVSEERSEAGAILISVKVAQEDIGRVIGKKGSTINAIRHVAKAASIKSGEKVDVDVKEEE